MIKLKPKKSMGSDNIPSYVIKGCKYILTENLQIIFNLSLKNEQFPEKFKIARITLVFKTGNRRDIMNIVPLRFFQIDLRCLNLCYMTTFMLT